MTGDEKYMSECLSLASRGAGFVSPNPMVGCVIVARGKVLARGYHKMYGGDHAEVEALKKLRNKEIKKLRDLTVYVNLEPCFHYGKTPPCVDALINFKPDRVVVGMKDLNPKTADKGIRKLRRAGIKVDVMENDPRLRESLLVRRIKELNEGFSKWVVTGRPFVLLKTAVTLDGALTLKKNTRSDFSRPESYVRVHELRQLYDAIAVGVNTARMDNPLLTSRGPGKRSHPTRVIFDTNFRMGEKAKMFNEPGRTIIFVGPKFSKNKKQSIERNCSRVEICEMPLGANSKVDFKHCIDWLGKNGVTSIMVEGGAEVANEFLKQKLIDKVMITFTPLVSSDIKAPRLDLTLLKKYLRDSRWEVMGTDAWLIGEQNS